MRIAELPRWVAKAARAERRAKKVAPRKTYQQHDAEMMEKCFRWMEGKRRGN